jgi:hypothetical protein
VKRVVRDAQLADEIARYRHEAAALALDRGRLQALLDGAAYAVVALDSAGRVVALNAPAARRLALTADRAVGIDVRAQLATGDAARFDTSLAEMDERDAPVPIDLAGLADATLAPLGGGSGLTVLSFAVDAAAAPDDYAIALDADSDEERDAYRRALVELMLATVAAWERSTGKTRIDLAEQSRIWRITIDEGRLRVRALERYLSLAKLPRRPRWREVLRTVYYVLTECPLEPGQRDALKSQLERVQDAVKRRSLL